MANALMAAYNQAKKKKPPRRNWGVTGAIPGFGGAQRTQQAKALADAQAKHDEFPYPRNVFRPKRRGSTRPTPGSVRKPRWD